MARSKMYAETYRMFRPIISWGCVYLFNGVLVICVVSSNDLKSVTFDDVWALAFWITVLMYIVTLIIKSRRSKKKAEVEKTISEAITLQSMMNSFDQLPEKDRQKLMVYLMQFPEEERPGIFLKILREHVM